MSKPLPPPGYAPSPTISMQCPYCHVPLHVNAAQAGDMTHCPQCNGRFQVPWPTATGGGTADPAVTEFASKKIAAGLCGILVGGFGVHKFILGFNTAGAIMLTVWLVGFVTGMCLVLPIMASAAMGIIGLVEGIIYLTKSDEEFYHTYAIQRKEWF